jgi:glucose-1-phosphate cytidylyltransferase
VKTVILAGGRGTRISEETSARPKPMVEIGNRPLLWHIMSIYARHGHHDFIICLGYKGYVIKEYFVNYLLHNSDVTFNLATGSVKVHRADAEPWNVTLIDTGVETMTGGRVRRALPFVSDEPAFFMTYGDGLGNIDISSLLAFHRAHGRLATLTAVQPSPRFGTLQIADGTVTQFSEKAQATAGWVNGGFFVLSPQISDYLVDDSTVWERGPLEELANEGQLMAYEHRGFWHPMDTVRDRDYLNQLSGEPVPPWTADSSPQ